METGSLIAIGCSILIVLVIVFLIYKKRSKKTTDTTKNSETTTKSTNDSDLDALISTLESEQEDNLSSDDL